MDGPHRLSIDFELSTRLSLGSDCRDVVALFSRYRVLGPRNGRFDEQPEQCRLAADHGVDRVERYPGRSGNVGDGGGDVAPLDEQAGGGIQDGAPGALGGRTAPSGVIGARGGLDVRVHVP